MRFGISATSWIFPKNLRTRLRPIKVCAVAMCSLLRRTYEGTDDSPEGRHQSRPRLAILHTSEAHFGQIYIPRVNTALLAGVLLLVLMFRTSSQLASAYGIAVTTTMVVDGVLGFIVIWKLWKWKWWSAALLVVP